MQSKLKYLGPFQQNIFAFRQMPSKKNLGKKKENEANRQKQRQIPVRSIVGSLLLSRLPNL